MTRSRLDQTTNDDLIPTSARLSEIAGAAARGVGDLLRDGFRERAAVAIKSDFHDLVTDYDARAEKLIRRHLADAVPNSQVVGEEMGTSTGDGEITWYVDPIDGTNNFAAGLPLFCVSIGATYRDRLVAGVVYDPVREELFSADLGGAAVNGRPMHARGERVDRTALLATDFPGHSESGFAGNGHSDADRLTEMIRAFRTVRRLGSSALALAYVAAGRIDVTAGVGAKPWDVAGGMMLIKAAGGAVHPLRSGDGDGVYAWGSPSYIACVADFDVTASCLADLLDGAR